MAMIPDEYKDLLKSQQKAAALETLKKDGSPQFTMLRFDWAGIRCNQAFGSYRNRH